ncbi:CoA ester lyase [Burkholderia sp. Bp8986]|uniref:HpcH/HpaI aldolase/citrate lyase family protein n=1 Tax=Burkholderia sp. Bp8986 TaxID=2184550 RepID=UPI000F5A277A|nr:CoA ester lyase [Burkholderia sp. Bp8986]RQS42921.1 CoA ester lyase [Burkholderia sp. Bp8986]
MTSTVRPEIPIRTRSWMFSPATDPKHFGKALEAGADVLIVDLEDAVALERKAEARTNVCALLDTPRDDALLPPLAVRINTPSSRTGIDDLIALLDARFEPTFILLPKIESPEPVVQVHSLLKGAGKSAHLVPLIESARGRSAIRTIAAACTRVAALMFGAADYASDVRAQPSSFALQVARCELASACAEAGITAIDSPCFVLNDEVQLALDLDFATRNGFTAKAAIHPSHIAPINAAFTPSPERLDWAHRVLAASEQGAGTVDGRMVDEAIAREARRVIASL